jgi:hypothetical protein
MNPGHPSVILLRCLMDTRRSIEEDDCFADVVIPCCSSNSFISSFLGIQTNFIKASRAFVNVSTIALEASLLFVVAHLTVVNSDAGIKPLIQVSKEIRF